MKHLMSGNEATARGVYEAGIKVCSAYPGTPSTEILENLPQYGQEVYCEWAPNEKVATEVAYGASVAGSRSFCTMKMVGLNVAADPLFTAGYMGVNGAYVVVTADDPSCHSSQNEQDNRHYARAAKIAMVEPSDAQECKDFVRLACEISEQFDTPVLYRTTTRVCHSKGLVEFGERVEHQAPAYARNPRKYVCAPANAYLNHPIVEERLVKLAEYGCTRALENGLNKVELGDGKVGVITASISYQYAKEVFPEGTSFLKLGLTYPLPMDLIRDFAKKVEKLYIIEELDPFMEDEIKAAGIDCVGKELTGKLYELNTELVRERVLGIKPAYKTVDEVKVAKRPPALCPGCPHRGFFYTLSKNKNYVITGDIGCYTLGMLPPLRMADFLVCMGSSVSAGSGFARASGKPVVAFIGDSTFFHSGMTGLANAVFNKHDILVVILDNGTTAMTGHQPNPGMLQDILGEEAMHLDIESVVRGLGVTECVKVRSYNLKALHSALEDMRDKKGVRVIIAEEPCVLYARRRLKKAAAQVAYVAEQGADAQRCLEELACPAFYRNGEDVAVDENLCTGCMVCLQVAPKAFKARKRA